MVMQWSGLHTAALWSKPSPPKAHSQWNRGPDKKELGHTPSIADGHVPEGGLEVGALYLWSSRGPGRGGGRGRSTWVCSIENPGVRE
jgi:hypothetical protein